MTHPELETLINSTNFTNDIDRNLFLMAMAEHDAEMDAAVEAEYKMPSWWYIATGGEDAAEPARAEAVKRFREYLAFQPLKQYSTRERVEAFSLAKINNKIRS